MTEIQCIDCKFKINELGAKLFAWRCTGFEIWRCPFCDDAQAGRPLYFRLSSLTYLTTSAQDSDVVGD